MAANVGGVGELQPSASPRVEAASLPLFSSAGGRKEKRRGRRFYLLAAVVTDGDGQQPSASSRVEAASPPLSSSTGGRKKSDGDVAFTYSRNGDISMAFFTVARGVISLKHSALRMALVCLAGVFAVSG